MARKANAPLLDAGDLFPVLELTLTDGTHLSLPTDLSRPYNVMLVNRGAWCPFCVTQLRTFQSGLAKLAEEGIGVVSLSSDSRDQASAVVAEQRLEFPVAYGASVDLVAGALGVYYDPHPAHAPPHLQSAGFVLGPGGSVLGKLKVGSATGLINLHLLGDLAVVNGSGLGGTGGHIPRHPMQPARQRGPAFQGLRLLGQRPLLGHNRVGPRLGDGFRTGKRVGGEQLARPLCFFQVLGCDDALHAAAALRADRPPRAHVGRLRRTRPPAAPRGRTPTAAARAAA